MIRDRPDPGAREAVALDAAARRRALDRIAHALDRLQPDHDAQDAAAEELRYAWRGLYGEQPPSLVLLSETAEELAAAHGLLRAAKLSRAARLVFHACAMRAVWRLLYSIGK